MRAIVLSAFWGLFYVVIWSDAVDVSKYTTETLTCDVTYGHVIATTRAYSAIHCSANCKNRVGCVSSVFDVSKGDCYLNNSTRRTGDSVQGECGKELKYIEKLAVITPCTSNGDCEWQDSPSICKTKDHYRCRSCREGRCKCYVDYDYNVIANTCLMNCTSYDDTFEYVFGMQIAFSSGHMHGNVSLTECRELCLCETNFTCRWFAYSADSAECTFTDNFRTGYDHSNLHARLFRRICAYP